MKASDTEMVQPQSEDGRLSPSKRAVSLPPMFVSCFGGVDELAPKAMSANHMLLK